ncbi:MAG: Uma2 family endonuclease [Isosphaeraceae bacterium]
MATVTAIPALEPSEEPEGLYERVGGEIVEKPGMGAKEAEVAHFLYDLVSPFVRSRSLGRFFMEMLFRLDSEQKLDRRPDLAFVSNDRWAVERRDMPGSAWEVIPDLAVEVISPGNRSVDDIRKLQEYFRAGVRRVWLIHPALEMVYIYDSPTSVKILTRGQALDGGEILPGFSLALDELFPDRSA